MKIFGIIRKFHQTCESQTENTEMLLFNKMEYLLTPLINATLDGLITHKLFGSVEFYRNLKMDGYGLSDETFSTFSKSRV